MRHIFGINVLAWACWGFMILAFRFALERRRQRAEQAATLRALEANIYDDPTLQHLREPRNAF